MKLTYNKKTDFFHHTERYLKEFPKKIMRNKNLKFINVKHTGLRELPKNFGKLTNLNPGYLLLHTRIQS